MKKKKSSKPVFLYLVILLLAIALAALAVLTFFSLNRLAALQSRVSDLQKTVQEISDSSASLTQKAQELKQLEEQQAALKEEASHPEGPPQEEGTLSPSHSQSFTENSDESMDTLLAQINTLLPSGNGTWSVYVCNLMKDTEGVIGGQAMQAASLIKLFIMGAVYENYETLTQQYGAETLDSSLQSMITVSDNDAANTLVSYLGNGDSAAGMNAVNAFCQAHGYTGTAMGRLLLQSSENGDNYTSVKDCGRFLKEIYKINNGTAATPSLSHADKMYDLLKMQERRNKIPANLPEGVQVANKTGELADVENDAGIIFNTANGIDLIVCFMSENLTDVGAAQASIAENARLIYGYYNE